jgi:hypothetical protein
MIKRIVVGAALAATGWAAYSSLRRWWATWGFDPVESSRSLPGDDLVTEPTTSETRAITIAAPPDAVWPWLVQMGYGRGGWYSYDAMDMKGASSDAIRPELQDLAVGDTVPTDPEGGFRVRIVEPEHALVLYVDQDIVGERRPAAATIDEVTPGVAISGRFLQTATPPEFSAAWAFILEPIAGGQTRLIERFRARMGVSTRASQILGPVLGFGIFVMTRRQMLGIKARAEKLARGREVLHRDVDEIAERALAAPVDELVPNVAPAAS